MGRMKKLTWSFAIIRLILLMMTEMIWLRFRSDDL